MLFTELVTAPDVRTLRQALLDSISNWCFRSLGTASTRSSLRKANLHNRLRQLHNLLAAPIQCISRHFSVDAKAV